MSRKRRVKSPLYKEARGVVLSPYLVKARLIRKSLLGRADGVYKDSTPLASEIEKWLLTLPLVCYYSNAPLTLETLVVDHKKPIARGGTNSLKNLCICTSGMNIAKGTLNEKEFKSLLKLIRTWEDGGKSLLTRLKLGLFK